MGTLWANGHAAYVVGGSLRDVMLGRQPHDWDLASDARPERLVELFPGAVYENRFGTVAVRRDDDVFQVTTFRTDHEYADFRRPHRIEFGDSIEVDQSLRAGIRCEVPVVRLAPKHHVTQRATDDVRRMPVGPERPHQVVDSRRDRALDRGP